MESIRGLVEKLFSDLELDAIPLRRKALSQWERFAGKALASACEEPYFEGSSLFVRTGNPAAAMELSYRRSELLEKLNTDAGETVFRTLKVLVRPSGKNKKGQL